MHTTHALVTFIRCTVAEMTDISTGTRLLNRRCASWRRIHYYFDYPIQIEMAVYGPTKV